MKGLWDGVKWVFSDCFVVPHNVHEESFLVAEVKVVTESVVRLLREFLELLQSH